MSADVALVGDTAGVDLVLPAGTCDEVARLVGQWLVVHGGGAENTYAAYRRDITEWLTFCEAHGIEPLKAAKSDVDAWHRIAAQIPTQRGTLPARATMARRVSSIASFYGYLVDEDEIAAVPVRRSTRPKAPTESQTVGLSAAEAAALEDRLPMESLLDRAVILTLLWQGLRISELLGLTVGALRHNTGEATMVVHGKGGKIREIPIDEAVQRAIAELLTHRFGDEEPPPADAVLFTTGLSRLSRQQVDRRIKRIARAAGIRSHAKLSPHSLRHTCVTLMLDGGAPLHVVQHFVGHASTETTGRYDRARGALNRSVAALGGMRRLISSQQADRPEAP